MISIFRGKVTAIFRMHQPTIGRVLLSLECLKAFFHAFPLLKNYRHGYNGGSKHKNAELSSSPASCY